MKRKHKIYSKPKRPFDKERILEENALKEEFGLKNKKEIWRADSKVKEMREKAKKLISASEEEQKKFFERLRKLGFNVKTIADILSLDKKDYLKRRIQTVLVVRKIAKTPKHARQLLTHRKVTVNGVVIDSPSYIVPVEFENKIELKMKNKKSKTKKSEESSEENN